ncbi:MAG: esterase [Blautia sp.]|nr:esterase [Blautia sp.]MBR2561878.1 esterase [Eubacterium sp.]
MEIEMIKRYGKQDALVVLIQMVDDYDLEGLATEMAEIQRLTDTEFCLLAIPVDNWNKDLSPWTAPAVFGKEDFGDGAKETLTEILKLTNDNTKSYIIGGYSLAGLFALWAVYQTDVFKGAAAASPSVWFPGFTDYMRERRPHTDSVYLSLGDKEEKTRNPVMAAVGDRIREASEILKSQGVTTTLEWNSGNHFKDAALRTARAFAWVIGL